VQNRRIRLEKKDGERSPSKSTSSATHKSSGADLCLPARYLILNPRGGNDEQRGEKEPEQRIQPDQRDVKATEAESHPDRAQRTVRFQGVLPNDVLVSEKLARRRRAFQCRQP
jgi:hypothetical protein